MLDERDLDGRRGPVYPVGSVCPGPTLPSKECLVLGLACRLPLPLPREAPGVCTGLILLGLLYLS